MLLTFQVGLGQYCLPTYSNMCTTGDYINSVTFAGIVNTGTGCSNPGASNYTDYTGAFTGNVVTNSPYTITCAPGPTWGQYFVALIDINHDLDFSDPGEFFDVGYSLGGGTVSNTITVPCNALTGLTKLRVMCRYANTPLTQADVCASLLSFGEVEEYTLNITQPASTDGMLSRFISPVTACGMGAAEIVRVKVKNVGGQTINGYTVCYSINNGAPVCETVATVILPCDSVTHTFAAPANLSVPAQYDFDATLTVAGDVNNANNALTNYYVDNIPVVGTLPYTENFDVTNGGWTTAGTASSWAWGVPAGTFISQAASPTKAWVTNLTGPYNLDELSYMISPCFNMTSLTTDPYMAFSHIFDIQQYSDVGYVELTTNAGTTWTRLGMSGTGNNWYNNTFSNVWDINSGLPGRWRAADQQLTGAAGNASVRVRFVLDSDAFTSNEGMGIDDVKILDTLKNAGALALVAPLTGCQLSATSPVSVSIKNFGSHPISNIPVCYTLNGGPAFCEVATGPIAPGATYTHNFGSTVNLSVPGSYNLKTYTNWTADYTRLNDTLSTTVSSLPLVNTFPYKQTFEAGQGGWTSGGTAFNDWAYGTPAKATITGAASGTNAWVTGGLGVGSYLDNANNWVESPCFDLSTLTNPWVMAKVWWNAEFSWDGAVLEYSTNGGTSWSEIGAFGDPFNWYTDNTVNGLSTAGGTGNGWSGRALSSNGSNGYVPAKHEIANLAGQSAVRFRIHFGSDASVVDDGFAFDDFVVADPPIVALGPDQVICGSYTINPGLSGGTFLWTGGATTPTLTVTNPDTYILQYTDSLGLSDADTMVVSLSPTPAVNLGNNAVVCSGDSTCFNISPANYPSVLWSTGDTTHVLCVGTAGSWSIQATDATGCTTNDTISTTIVAPPTPSIGPDTTICPGATVCIASNCGPNHSYIWSNGATTSQICVSVAAGYWVICIDANGCEGADSIIVNQALLPVAAGTADTSNCPIVQFTNASTGATTGVTWHFGDGGTSTAANPSHDYTAAGNGSYTVLLIGANDCGNDTTTILVDVNCLVSIGGAMDNQLRLFPNPSQGKFKLEATLTGTAPVQVTIVDVHGRAVYTRGYATAAGHFSEEINLEATKGVYFVKFDVGGEVTVKKLVLQ